MSIVQSAEVQKARLDFLDKVIDALPEDEKREDDPKKACRNCYNLGATVIPLALYWAERRCHYCDKYDSWQHVRKLRNEIADEGTVTE